MFDSMKRSHARHYIEGLEEKDLILHPSKLSAGVDVKLDDTGTLVLLNDESITFGRHVLLRLPTSLVNVGFAQTIMLYKGETFNYTSAMWNFLDEEQREDLLQALDGSHQILIHTFSRNY